MAAPKKILFIINPISGVGKKNSIPPLIEEHLPKEEFECEIRYTQYRGHGHEIAKSEHNKYDAIVAVGGDGSVNEVGSALIDTDCALGIVPAGSGNGFARHIGVPLKHPESIKRLREYNITRFDSGEVNGQPFLGTCGFGFDAHIAKKFDEYHKRGFGSYIKLVIKEYSKYNAPKFSIQVGDDIINDDYVMCSVANSDQFGNDFVISPNSDGSDGQLELILIRRFNMVTATAVVGRFFNRTIHKSKFFERVNFSDEVTVSLVGQDKADYHLDGEPFKGGPEFVVKLKKASLRLI